jgi:hypothetical protein
MGCETSTTISRFVDSYQELGTKYDLITVNNCFLKVTNGGKGGCIDIEHKKCDQSLTVTTTTFYLCTTTDQWGVASIQKQKRIRSPKSVFAKQHATDSEVSSISVSMGRQTLLRK